jgi:DNA-binding transcriptional LysR family regulator
MSVTFKDLENFIVVAQSRTLSEASEKLDMAQPSLSLAIKKLEVELKIPLFIRSRQGIKLTPQGRMILPEAQSALKLLFQIKGVSTGLSFKIGCHPSVGMFLLGRFLKLMNQYDSKLDFIIINGSSNEINKKVAQGEVDFGLVMNPLPIPGLITKLIGEDDVAVWESRKRFSKRLIYNPELIQSSGILSRWKSAPVERIEVANLELIANLVESGAGYGILPSQVVKAQRYDLQRVAGAPTYKDRLALVCYPEIIKSKEGKIIFEELKKSFIPNHQ